MDSIWQNILPIQSIGVVQVSDVQPVLAPLHLSQGPGSTGAQECGSYREWGDCD